MKLTLTPRTQRAIAIGMLLVLVALAVEIVVWPMWAASAQHAERIDMLKRQAMTMESLAAAAPKFEALAKKLAANPEAQQLTFAAPQSTLAVAQLQGQLGQLLAGAPAVVTSSQPMPEAKDGALTKIAVQTTFETDIKGLVKALHGIESARPLLTIEKLTVRDPDGEWAVAPQANAPNKLQVDITVSAYMRVP